ncbi:MAG: DUF4145 domain-containing protein [Clostridiaceae bacterium]
MKSDSVKCPFCQSVFPCIDTCYRLRFPSFNYAESDKTAKSFHEKLESYKDVICVEFALCPACQKTSIKIWGMGEEVVGISHNFHPSSNARKFPDYVPGAILQDYEEACSIANLSPKASATLSRRCLQGMIRDYWSISGKKNLYEEIEAIQDKIDPQVAKVLNGVRQLGNIGAHMEKAIDLIIDIDPNEAEKLIQLIEYLIEQWYIKRHDSDDLLKSILVINGKKQEERKSK